MSECYYRRVDDAQAREVGDEIFLVVPASGEIHHLNAVAAAIWRVLETQTSRDGLEDLLAEAFEGVSREQIAADVAALLETLLDLDLITVSS